MKTLCLNAPGKTFFEIFFHAFFGHFKNLNFICTAFVRSGLKNKKIKHNLFFGVF